MKKILLLGYYGANNLGDEIMLYFILNKISYKDNKITAISENPGITSQQFKLDCIKNEPLFFEWGGIKNGFKKSFYVLIKNLISTNLLIVGGGDLIRDDKGWRTFFYTVEKILIAKLFKAQVYFINVGFGKPATKYGKYILSKILKSAKLVVVRDYKSYNICNKIINEPSKLKYLVDIAVKIRSEVELKISNEDDILLQSDYIVVSLRENCNAFGQFIFSAKRKNNFAASLDFIVEKYKVNIIFLPFQNSNREQDIRIHEDIYRQMKNQKKSTVLCWTEDFRQVAKIIGNARALVGMRLHSIVLGSALNIPCIALPYDYKIYEYCSKVGVDNFLEDHQLDNNHALINQIDILLNGDFKYFIEDEGWSEIKLP